MRKFQLEFTLSDFSEGEEKQYQGYLDNNDVINLALDFVNSIQTIYKNSNRTISSNENRSVVQIERVK